jgi:tRNA (guanine6-N2)-methyltransferase
MTMKRIFAMTTPGLEEVGAAELETVRDVAITETDYRRLAALCTEESLAALLDLRTLDDVYIESATWEGIRHTRDTLKVLEEYCRGLDLKPDAKTCAGIRPIPPRPTFSVTASFISKRNYNTDEIKAAVAAGITAFHPWQYTEDDREADLNMRLFVMYETGYVGLRLGKHPLHERGYERIERPGALKPTIAAAMLQLAHVRKGMQLLDPCCGTGTILIEGAQIGAVARGGDIQPQAVSAARSNISAAGVLAKVEKWDARVLPLRDGSVDRIVTNLPWGKQISLEEEMAAFYRDVCREMERVLAPGGRLAVLTSVPELLHFTQLHAQEPVVISLFGERPTIALYRAIP